MAASSVQETCTISTERKLMSHLGLAYSNAEHSSKQLMEYDKLAGLDRLGWSTKGSV